MVIFFGEKLPAPPAFPHFEGIKLGSVLLHDAVHGRLHLLHGHFVFHEAKGVIDEFGYINGCKRLIAGKYQGFNMGYDMTYLHCSLFGSELFLPLQCRCSAYYLRQLCGDGRLASAIIGYFQRFKQLIGIFGGFIHCGHTCPVFGGVGVQHRFI